MSSPLRTLAAHALRLVRRAPLVHRPVHAVAERLARTRWGARFIRSVTESPVAAPSGYEAWARRYDTLSAADLAAIAAHIARMSHRPLISVVMPVYAPPAKLLREAIESVRGQLYPHWELCIADDASPGEATWRVLSDYAARDPRIKVVRRDTNGHICAATNSALALASGAFVALMDHDDLLPARALYEVAAVVDRHPDADIVYSDEDKIDDRGMRFEPYFKSGWNPDLLLGQNMVSHLGVYRRRLIEQAGGLREGFEGSQDYDLTLRACELTEPARIHHIPWVLYHWRQQGLTASFSESQMARCADAARLAVTEHLARTGEGGEVTNLPTMAGWLKVKRPLPSPAPLVSIIVPTRDRADLLAACAEGVLTGTDYAPLEFLIVDNGSVEPETHTLFDRLRTDPRVRILSAPGPFNFSALNNRAAREAKGEVLVLLNNDISMPRRDWLAELVSHAVRPNVGAVGAKLLFPDGTVQHAGVVLGVGGVAAHMGPGVKAGDPGYFGQLGMTRNVAAVTAACLAVRKAVYDAVGGLDEQAFAVAYNDIDFCLRLRAAGHDIVWTPDAQLIHHESASRGADRGERFAREAAEMRARWGHVLDADPFYHPNFDGRHTDFRLAYPPRRRAPWLDAT